MAKPRIFVSSTCYDLKQIRADLERFIHSMGYEPILNEQGHIPYGSDESLEEYCYKEVELCDILVGIIGGRFGSQSASSDQSITQTEIETALTSEKQVYIFIEKSVNSEYSIYQANKENAEIADKIKYTNTDDKRIFEYIEKIKKLDKNNIIHTFENADDICKFLKEQWAGLFKRFLQHQEKQKFTNTLDKINSTANTLQDMVDYLSSQNKDAMKDILLSNHPAMDRVKNILNSKAKLYFSNINELDDCFLQFEYYKIDKICSSFSEQFYKNQKNDILITNDIDSNTFTNKQSEQAINLLDKEFIIYYSFQSKTIVLVKKNIFDSKRKLIPCNHNDWKDGDITTFSTNNTCENSNNYLDTVKWKKSLSNVKKNK